MAQLFMDGFDHYGLDEANMRSGVWAEANRVTLVRPSFGARTGQTCLRGDTFARARRVLPTFGSEIFVGFGFYVENLPVASNRIIDFYNAVSAVEPLVSINITSAGSMSVRSDNAANLLGQTAGPVIEAGRWHYIEIRVVTNETAGLVEIRVDETEVFNVSSVDTTADTVAQVGWRHEANQYIDDVVARNTAGSVNNGFEGDLRVALLQPVANATNQGWAVRSIQNIGQGVVEFTDRSSTPDAHLRIADDPVLELGNFDYTLEMFFRLNRVLNTDDVVVLSSKYSELNDRRSWRLYITGPDLEQSIIFENSENGTQEDTLRIHQFPFVPQPNIWYHVAVTRQSNVNRLFIDGRQIGSDSADNRSYFNGTASVAISGSFGQSSVTIDGNGVYGFMDGYRLTIGAARYVENFDVPTEPYPTDLTGDPLFSQVQLLYNFDDGINQDESQNAFTTITTISTNHLLPNDRLAYQTIDGTSPNDLNFIEASFIPAEGTLTFTVNPLDTETVVLGSVTYTFQTTLVNTANNVLIGADPAATLNNLRAAVNETAGAGTTYGTGTTRNPDATMTDLIPLQKLAIASTPGAVGNAIVTTTTVTGGTWSAATLAGGQDVPGNSEFELSNLPPEVTGIRAVTIVTRAFKTDAGVTGFRAGFVSENGSALLGATRPLTVNPSYYEDQFEADPATGGALTPTSLLNARIRVDRTE